MANQNYDEEYENANYANRINDQMKVSKHIKATGEYYEDDFLSNGNSYLPWNYHDKIEMNVPDRIVIGPHLVLGSGTKSAPREILLENSLLPKDPGFIRVSTPPRVITMSEHHFPTATDDPEDEDEPKSIESINNDMPNNKESMNRQTGRYRPSFNTSDVVMSRREQTPTFSSSIENLAGSDEVLHLRRQVAKLNRRVLSIELDNLQRQQREKIVYCMGLAYFLLKAIVWLNKK